MTAVERSSGGRRQWLRWAVAALFCAAMIGACLWAYLRQYEFTDGHYASLRDVHGIDDAFPEVVVGPDVFARWKSDGYMEQIVAWGRSDEARLKKFADEFGWDWSDDGGTVGNSKLDLIGEEIREGVQFTDADPWMIGKVPLRSTSAGIKVYYSRDAHVALVEIRR